METKKSIKANLENKRSIFLEIGLIATMAVVLMAFEWYSPQERVAFNGTPNYFTPEFDATVITRPEKNVTPPPPAVRMDFINIVENDELESYIETYKLDFTGDYDINYLPEEMDDDPPFRIVQNMPKYKGGDLTTFWKDVNSRLRYPEVAREMGIEGSVFVQFIVDKKGKMINIEIVRSDDPVFNSEVLRVLRESEDWTPGKQRDKYVKVSYSMMFKFKIADF